MTRKFSLTPYLFLAAGARRCSASSSSTRSSRSSTTASPTTTSSGRRSGSASTTTRSCSTTTTFWLALVALVRLPDGHADPDRPVDRAGDHRQPPAARASTSSGRCTSCPAVSGSIAIGLAWRWLFDRNGLHQQRPAVAGASSTEPIQWLATPALVLPIAMLLTIWAGVGYYSVIFLAGLQNIPEELYDAARIDGCNDFQKHRYVSLPGPAPADRLRGRHLEPRRAQGVRRDLRPDEPDRRHPRQRRDDGLLPLEAGVPAAATRGTRRRSRSCCWRSRWPSRSSTCASSSAARRPTA